MQLCNALFCWSVNATRVTMMNRRNETMFSYDQNMSFDETTKDLA